MNRRKIRRYLVNVEEFPNYFMNVGYTQRSMYYLNSEHRSKLNKINQVLLCDNDDLKITIRDDFELKIKNFRKLKGL